MVEAEPVRKRHGPTSVEPPSTTISPEIARPKAVPGKIPAVRTMLAIVAITFAVEMTIMAVFGQWGLAARSPLVGVADAAIISILIGPLIYWLLVRPIRREYEKRLEVEARARELDHLATTDVLTEVMNRRGIEARLLEAMAQAERYDRQLSVAMIDLDRFKNVNDRHGHAVGDQVLKQVVSLFSSSLRASDLIGRYGGDEFLVILPETELTVTLGLADRICEQIDETEFDVAGVKLRLGVSIGATDLIPGESLEEILLRLDRALYGAKRSGRQKVKRVLV